MFYLMAFLSLLVGIFIYAFDPVPMDARRSLNVRSGEVLVIPFLNQHQAAKDYLKHWLGKVYPGGQDVKITIDGEDRIIKNQVATVSGGISPPPSFTFLTDFTKDAAVIALPPTLSDFMFPLESQQFYVSTVSEDTALLQAQAADGYVSALVCLDRSGALTRCYTYNCKNTSDYKEDDGCDQEDVERVRWHSSVAKRLVITYSLHEGISNQDEDDYETVNSKALRQELWRKAMASRSHNSDTCGFLVSAPAGQYWDYNPNFRDDKRVTLSSDVTKPKYCIHNGHRCMSVLSSYLKAYLESATMVLDRPVEEKRNLDDFLFCMSEVQDPYKRIVGPDYHYDGVDALAVGAEQGMSDPNDTTDKNWRPVSSNTFKSDYYTNRYLVNAPKMLFKEQDKDFTLSFVTQGLKAKPSSNIYLLRDDDEDIDAAPWWFSIEKNTNFIFHPNRTDNVELTMLTGTDLSSPMAWTVMHRNGNMYLFINGCQVACAASEALDGKRIMQFGDNEDTAKLMDVRYYNEALTVDQLRRNFKLDMVRYNVASFKCTEREMQNLPERGYPTCSVGGAPAAEP